MPQKKTIQRARRDAAEGKAPSTQAGEFVREQIRKIRAGKHGARSAKQAIAIGLSEARRSGVPLAPPAGNRRMGKKARQDLRAAAKQSAPSPTRSRASVSALKRERGGSASHEALSRQSRRTAKNRGSQARARAARKAARTRKRSSH